MITHDNDAGLTFAPTSLNVPEGMSASYTVVLDAQPGGTVTVTISGAGSGVTVNPAVLAFTVSDWATPQTVTVAAAEDSNNASESVTLLHTAAGGDYGAVSGEVMVTTADNEAGLTFAPASLSVTEGMSASYTVVLNAQPMGTVTVDITGAGSGVSVSPAVLAFTVSDWATPQTVTVTAAEDGNGASESVTLTHTASGGGYGGVSGALVVTTADDDARLAFAPTSLTVPEGMSASYTVVLNAEPSGTVTVSISGAGSGVSVSTTALAFTQANWATPQTVTVTAAEDGNIASESVTLMHTAAGGGYDAVSGAVMVTTADNDAGLTLDRTSLIVPEGMSASYAVVLDAQPSGTVSVAITGAGSGVSVSPASLSFTPSDWSTPQTVTVTAAEDDNTASESVTLTHTAVGGDYAGQTAALSVSTTDNDSPALLLSSAALPVTEGSSATYTVALATEPSGDVAVAITGAERGVSVSPSLLGFTPSDWSTPQTVTVAAAEDDNTASESVTLTHTAAGGGYAGQTATLSVSTTDNDAAALLLSPAALPVTEGSSATYTVALATQPSGTVTVAITGAGSGVSVSPASLGFTPSDWSTPQTVTVTAAEDDNTASESVTLTHTAAGGGYAGQTATLSVSTTDNDAAALLLSPAALPVTEGSSATYTVALATQPSGDVTVAITGAERGVSVSPASLGFTPSDWSMPQTVTVTAAEDDNTASESVTLTHTAVGGGYAGQTATLSVSTTDNDSAALLLSPAALPVTEGSSATYTVALATQPSGDVTVAITGAERGVSVSPSLLGFTPSDWSTPQTVTVTAAEDDNTASESVTLTHTAVGGGYAGQTATLSVSTTDNDSAALLLSPAALPVTEGSSATYTVALATQPSGTVTVAITGAGSGVSVSPASLDFTPSDWSMPQTVTVTAAEDDNTASESVTLTHTAAGGGYAGQTATLSVSTTDNDAAALLLSPAALPVTEGSSATYTVALATQPSGDVTVAITGAGSGVSVSPASLGFTPSDWSTPRTVTVTAAEDDNTASERVTLTHTAAGGGYAGQTATLSVSTTDNDAAALLLSPAALPVTEGSSATYTVALATQPSGDVTVAITGAERGVSVSPTLLGFTPSDWSTPQTVTVAAAEDDNTASESVTLTHTAVGGGYAGQTATLSVSTTDNDSAAPFTDHPIVAGETPIRAVHFTELRTQIGEVRARLGLERYPWTDPGLSAGVTRVRLVHLLELRWALAEAYAAAGRPAPSWTDASARAGSTPIRGAHVMELRTAVVALE